MAGQFLLGLLAGALLEGFTNATPIPEPPVWTSGVAFNVYAWSDLQYGLPLFFDTDTGNIFMTDYESAAQTDTFLPLAFQIPNSKSGSKPGFPMHVQVDTAAPMENKAMQSPPFSDAQFVLPAEKSPSRGLGVLTNNAAVDTDDVIASKFIIYEKELAIMRSDGRLLFGGYCAFQTDRPKVYSVQYNVTSDLKKVGIPIDFLTAKPGSDYKFKEPKDRYSGDCRMIDSLEA